MTSMLENSVTVVLTCKITSPAQGLIVNDLVHDTVRELPQTSKIIDLIQICIALSLGGPRKAKYFIGSPR